MAGGVRIRHVTDVAPVIIAVRDITEPIKNPKNRNWPGCSICGIPPSPADAPIGHQGFKTRHITLDADGTAIVSPAVWAGLSKFVDAGGFTLDGTVANPPAVTLSFQKGRDPSITVHEKVPQELTTEFLKQLGADNGDRSP
jgi:hypothetical protein